MRYHLRILSEKGQVTHMDRPIREHLRALHQRIQELNEKIMENRLTTEERNLVESEIRAAQLALEHFRKALELEHHFA